MGNLYEIYNGEEDERELLPGVLNDFDFNVQGNLRFVLNDTYDAVNWDTNESITKEECVKYPDSIVNYQGKNVKEFLEALIQLNSSLYPENPFYISIWEDQGELYYGVNVTLDNGMCAMHNGEIMEEISGKRKSIGWAWLEKQYEDVKTEVEMLEMTTETLHSQLDALYESEMDY